MYRESMDEDDFDFKRMIEQISDPNYVAAAAAAAHAVAQQSMNRVGSFHTLPTSASALYSQQQQQSHHHHHHPSMQQNAMMVAAAAAAAAAQASGQSGQQQQQQMYHPTVESLKRGGGGDMMMAGGGAGHSRSSSLSAGAGGANGSSELGSRLRAASELFQRGEISNDQKAVMKSLVLKKDAQFTEEFEKSQKTRELGPLKALLASKQKDMNVTPSVIDSLGVSDISLGKDRSGSTSSVNQAFDLGLSRKRNASTSTPIARSHKSIATASSQGDYQVRVPTGIAASTPMGAMNLFPQINMSPTMFPITGASLLQQLPIQHQMQPFHQEMPKQVQVESPDDDDESQLDDKSAKFKKNERERRRRATLSNGFDSLAKILKIPPDAKIDKAAILQHAIVKIAQLQQAVERLEGEREGLVSALQQRPHFSQNS